MKSFKLIIIFLLAYQFCQGQNNNGNTINLFNSIVEAYSNTGYFSGVVLLAKGDSIVYNQAYGHASKEWKAPNSIDTKFNLGSITKIFTAVGIIKLVEQGKLKYENTIADIISDYPNKEVAKSITIHQLLTHTSGIMRDLENATADISHYKLVNEFNEGYENEPLSFPPGEFNYSNVGYFLLGRVIEVVANKSYYDFIQEEVFNHLEMSNTGFYEVNKLTNNLASGYTQLDNYEPTPNGELINSMLMLHTKGNPAGGNHGTAKDLFKFSRALHSGNFIKPKSLKTMLPSDSSNYGYGIKKYDYGNMESYGHDGLFPGFSSYMQYYPDKDITLIVLANYEFGAGYISRILGDILANVVPEMPKTLTADQVNEVIGDYEFTSGNNKGQQIEFKKGFAQDIWVNDDLRFIPIKDGLYHHFSDPNINLKFTKSNDVITGFRFIQDGKAQSEAKKIKASEKDSNVAKAIDKNTLAIYEGKYLSNRKTKRGEDIIAIIRANDNGLHMEFSPKNRIQFLLLENDTFFVDGERYFQIHFERNSENIITGIRTIVRGEEIDSFTKL
ncbi:MAG: beta-lactamase family protein [Muricauda sp.]|nr:serine hydrolase domain-containing protein [Allomuricauda sp.]MBA4745991.1 beta-lactamase family protein [Allomuricauda sp.]